MWEHPCVACVGLIFFGVRTVLVYLPASSFLGGHHAGHYPLVGGVTGVVVTKACIG